MLMSMNRQIVLASGRFTLTVPIHDMPRGSATEIVVVLRSISHSTGQIQR